MCRNAGRVWKSGVRVWTWRARHLVAIRVLFFAKLAFGGLPTNRTTSDVSAAALERNGTWAQLMREDCGTSRQLSKGKAGHFAGMLREFNLGS